MKLVLNILGFYFLLIFLQTCLTLFNISMCCTDYFVQYAAF